MEWAVPYIGRTPAPKTRAFRTNLIPQSDSRQQPPKQLSRVDSPRRDILTASRTPLPFPRSSRAHSPPRHPPADAVPVPRLHRRLHRPHQRRLRRAANDRGAALLRRSLWIRIGRVFRRLWSARHSRRRAHRKMERAQSHRRHHADLGLRRVGHRTHPQRARILRDALRAGRHRSRIFPRRDRLPESLVSCQGPGQGRSDVHGGHSGIAGDCRAAFGRAHENKLAGACGMAMAADTRRRAGSDRRGNQLGLSG